MQNSRGFTLIELIMVIILIGVVSAAASSLFTRTSSFSAVAARDQMIAIATVAQKRALADSAATQSVFLRIIQTSGEWTLAVLQGTTELSTLTIQRNGTTLTIDGTALADGASHNVRYAGNGFTGTNQTWGVSADQSHILCITSSGYSHDGNCQP